MKNDFERIQEVILGIDNISQVEVCDKMIKNYLVIHGLDASIYSATLFGMLEATRILKFKTN